MVLKKECSTNIKHQTKYSRALSNFIIFKQEENKFSIDYQKILKYRDHIAHETHST
jgi:hypothetical protein